MNGTCTRCQKDVGVVFVIDKGPSHLWATPEVGWDKPPVYEASCGDCLSDNELADRLAPITMFALNAMIAKAALGSDLFRSLERVSAWIHMKRGRPFNPQDMRARALDTIQGRAIAEDLRNRVIGLQSAARNWQTIAEGAQNDLARYLASDKRVSND